MSTAEDVYKRRSRAFFDARASAYDQSTHMGIRPELLASILEHLASFPRPDSILDIGCGTGALLLELKSRLEVGVMAGLDLSDKMLELARQKLGTSVDLRLGDSEALPWEANCFDLVCCTLAFHHYPQPEQAIAEMRRVLKPGGNLLLADVTLPAPLRQLTNLVLPLLSTGDRHAYSRAEIFSLLNQAGFQGLTWKKVRFDTFLVSARSP